MSASVHYKFRSAKHFGRVQFEGDFIQLAELKVAIVEQEKLQFGEDFDLQVVDAQTQEEYHDEELLLPKNTSVIVKRIPASHKQGILSQIALAKKNERFAEILDLSTAGGGASAGVLAAAARQFLAGKLGPVSGVNPSASSSEPARLRSGDEETRLTSVIQAAGAGDWGANQRAGQRQSGRSVGANATDGPPVGAQPPPGYVCHRCGEPGHYIQHCTANLDGDVNVIRVKRPTGIPRSMLKTIDAPLDGGTELQLPGGKFVTLATDDREFTKEPLAVRMARLAEARAAHEGEVKDAAVTPAASEPNPPVSDDKSESETSRMQDTASAMQTVVTEHLPPVSDGSDHQRDATLLPADIRQDLPYFPLPPPDQKEKFFGEQQPPTAREFQEVVWGIILMNRDHLLSEEHTYATDAEAPEEQAPAIATDATKHPAARGKAPSRPSDNADAMQEADERGDSATQHIAASQHLHAASLQRRRHPESNGHARHMTKQADSAPFRRKQMERPEHHRPLQATSHPQTNAKQDVPTNRRNLENAASKDRPHGSNPSTSQDERSHRAGEDRSAPEGPAAAERTARTHLPTVKPAERVRLPSKGDSGRARPSDTTRSTMSDAAGFGSSCLGEHQRCKATGESSMVPNRKNTPYEPGGRSTVAAPQAKGRPEHGFVPSAGRRQHRTEPMSQPETTSMQQDFGPRRGNLNELKRVRPEPAPTLSESARDDARTPLASAQPKSTGGTEALARNSFPLSSKEATKSAASLKIATTNRTKRPVEQRRDAAYHRMDNRFGGSFLNSEDMPHGNPHFAHTAQKDQTGAGARHPQSSLEPRLMAGSGRVTSQAQHAQASTSPPERSSVPVFARLGPRVEQKKGEQGERVSSPMSIPRSAPKEPGDSSSKTAHLSSKTPDNKRGLTSVVTEPRKPHYETASDTSRASFKRPTASAVTPSDKRRRVATEPQEQAAASVFRRLGPALSIPTHLAKRISAAKTAAGESSANNSFVPTQAGAASTKNSSKSVYQDHQAPRASRTADISTNQTAQERTRPKQAGLPW